MTESSLLTIVSAADQRYWRCLYQFLRSAERRKLPARHRFIAYDLGLDEDSRRLLAARFPWCEFRRFPFANYPPHVALGRGTFAWKPIIIAEVLAQAPGHVLWLDSATLFRTDDFRELLPVIDTRGTYTLMGQEHLARRCDPRTLAALAVPAEHFDKPERAAGVIGLDGGRSAVRDLVAEWKEQALTEEYICPRVPKLTFHRPDQSLLSILLYRYEAAGRLDLNQDEIDISCARPVRWMSSRNFVPKCMPRWADALCRAYYFVCKTVDQAGWKFKHWRASRWDGLSRYSREHFSVFLTRLEDGRTSPIPAPKWSYYADPFIWEHAGRLCVFVEQFEYLQCRGRLCCVRLDDTLSPEPPIAILPRATHASFPLLFEHESRLYLLPETTATGCIDLYVCEEFPQRWRLARRLLYGVDAADSILLAHESRWWLITYLRDPSSNSPRHLAVYFTDDLLCGKWQPHPVNAERRQSGALRNAGPIVRDGQRLLRLTQQNPDYYGQSVKVMQIERLTPTEFLEVPYMGDHPVAAIADRHSPHHIAMRKDWIVWDVRDRTSVAQSIARSIPLLNLRIAKSKSMRAPTSPAAQIR